MSKNHKDRIKEVLDGLNSKTSKAIDGIIKDSGVKMSKENYLTLSYPQLTSSERMAEAAVKYFNICAANGTLMGSKRVKKAYGSA